MNKQDVIDILGFEPKNGGSYFFEKEAWFRPDWISGMYVSATKVMFHPNNNWMKIEYKLEGEWEKFFEGSIETKEDLVKLLKQIGYE